VDTLEKEKQLQLASLSKIYIAKTTQNGGTNVIGKKPL
jgi:hypothetical protein